MLYVNRLTPISYPATVRAITFFVPESVPVGTDLTMLVGASPTGGATINGTTFVSVITGRTSAVTDPAAWSQPAINLLQRQRAEQADIQALRA